MNKIEHYLRKNNIELIFKENTQKLGINKNNKCNSLITEVSLYKLDKYLLGVKRSGRSQYFLFDKDLNIIINEAFQDEFLKKLDDVLASKAPDVTLINRFFKELRESNNVSQQQLAKAIDKSLRTVMAYESFRLYITVEVLEGLLNFFKLSILDYKDKFNKFLEINNLELDFNSFIINKLLIKHNTKKDIDDLVEVKYLLGKYNKKLSSIYRYTKIANEEMKEEYKIVKGKVSLKKFDEVFRRFNDEQ